MHLVVRVKFVFTDVFNLWTPSETLDKEFWPQPCSFFAYVQSILKLSTFSLLE